MTYGEKTRTRTKNILFFSLAAIIVAVTTFAYFAAYFVRGYA